MHVMKTLAVASQKGGAGKTTVALHLAVALTHPRAGQNPLRCLIADLDPQCSAWRWGHMRTQKAGRALEVLAAQAAQLAVMQASAARHGCDLLILDTAPQGEQPLRAAVQAADLALVPVRPSLLDLRTLHATLDICQARPTPTGLVLNAVQAGTVLATEAREALETVARSCGISLAPELGQRTAYARALRAAQGVTEFEPRGRAAVEMATRAAWVRQALSLPYSQART